MSLTILVTGFGPFPGAPFNPTGPLARRLAHMRRPAVANVRVVTHVFPTSYAAVDRELPMLIAKHKPRALLMFGLASRSRNARVETRARNRLSPLPDAAGVSTDRYVITVGKPASVPLPAPWRALLGAFHGTVPTALSRDAGRYLCNYLCWRAAELTSAETGLRIAAFIHVPLVRRGSRRKRSKASLTLDDLVMAGARALVTIAAEARR